MKTICIVPCGKKKIWTLEPNRGRVRAKNAYVGSFATKCRQYAEAFYPQSWYILSAKHGFLSPDDYVSGPYDTTFSRAQPEPISVETLRVQAARKRLADAAKVVVLGGKDYRRIVCDIFGKKRVTAPLQGLKGIGYMLRALNQALEGQCRMP